MPNAARGYPPDVGPEQPDGALAGFSASAGGAESVSIENVTVGVYTVVVEHYASVAGSYTASAALAF